MVITDFIKTVKMIDFSFIISVDAVDDGVILLGLRNSFQDSPKKKQWQANT